MALWRRVFTLKEEEYEETAEILQECLQDSNNKQNNLHGGGPITSPFAVEARQDFLRSIALRNKDTNNHNTRPAAAAPRAATAAQHGGGVSLSLPSLTLQERNSIHERSINEPNLHVDAMYLPQ